MAAATSAPVLDLNSADAEEATAGESSIPADSGAPINFGWRVRFVEGYRVVERGTWHLSCYLATLIRHRAYWLAVSSVLTGPRANER